MDSFLIRGGTRLKGKIEISGSKNSALPILAGPEIGVASTKAFTCQLAVLAAFSAILARA